MLPKEKAQELYEKYLPFVDCGDNRYTTTVQEQTAKECAIIAVDQIILEQCKSSELKNAVYQAERIDYWQSVKNEISNL
jgi:hypothetical protein